MHSIKGQVERHVTGRVPLTAHGLYKVPFVRAVYKATSHKEEPPKTKHVRRIILESHSVHGAVSFYRELAKQSIYKNDVVCWKALCTVHRLLMEGHPSVLKDSTYELRFFEDLINVWDRCHNGYAVLNVAYCRFLMDKIAFHEKQPIFDGSISLETFLRTTGNRMPDNDTCFGIVSNLLDHQDGVLKFEKQIFANSPAQVLETQIFALIPLVLESYAIYCVITYFMKELVNRIDNLELFEYLTGRYYAQYIDLRDFYFKANNIHSITSVIPVPMLSSDPPQFVKKQTIERRTRRTTRSLSGKRRAETKPTPPQPQPQPQPTFQPIPTPQPQPQPIVSPKPAFDPTFVQTKPRSITTPPGWVPFHSDITGPSFVPPAVPQPQPVAPATKPVPTVTQPPAPGGSFFLSLMGMANEHKNAIDKPATPKEAPTFNPPPVREEEKKLVPDSQLKDALEQIAKLKEQNDKILQKMKELEEQNRALVEKNNALQAENSDLRHRVDSLLEDREEEKRQRLLDDLEKAYQLVDNSLFHLDSPTNLGNPDATTQSLLDSSKDLAHKIALLLSSVQGGKEDEIKKAIEALMESNKKFMDNAKGCSYLTENPEIRKLLLEAARKSGRSTTELLNALMSAIGSQEDWTDISNIKAKADFIRAVLEEVIKAAERLDDEKEKQHPDEAQEDLEALAENELLAAARIIEEAAKQLLAAKNAPRQPKPAGEIDVTGPIMDAASAIADAAAHLMRAASEAQKERVAQGKLPNSASSYKRDPAWSEGLISAAKYVVSATQQLTKAANDVVKGKVDEPALIAASRAVAAATAQLVAASKAKASPFSKPQESLMRASSLVTAAVDKLVAAARAAAAHKDSQEQPLDLSGLSATENKILQMNQATKIIQLENQLAKEIDKLKRMREAEYQAGKQSIAAAPSFEKQLKDH